MGLFGPGADEEVAVALRVTGPAEMVLPPPHLLTNRKAIAEANYLIGFWNAIASRDAETQLPTMRELVRKHLAPSLPGTLSRGRPDGWDPVEPLAVGLAMGWTLPTTLGRSMRPGLVRSGVVTAWLHLAAVTLFSDLAHDPLVDALAGWGAWTGYIGRVNGLDPQRLGSYVTACAARASDLAGFVPAD
ncbi:hypothetical protein [Geodermatophilus sp. URMC 64]